MADPGFEMEGHKLQVCPSIFPSLSHSFPSLLSPPTSYPPLTLLPPSPFSFPLPPPSNSLQGSLVNPASESGGASQQMVIGAC